MLVIAGRISGHQPLVTALLPKKCPSKAYKTHRLVKKCKLLLLDNVKPGKLNYYRIFKILEMIIYYLTTPSFLALFLIFGLTSGLITVMFSLFQLEAVDGCGIVFPVSVWMKKLTWEDEPRCIAVMEPVERKTAMVLFDVKVIRCIHQTVNYDFPPESVLLIPLSVTELVYHIFW